MRTLRQDVFDRGTSIWTLGFECSMKAKAVRTLGSRSRTIRNRIGPDTKVWQELLEHRGKDNSDSEAKMMLGVPFHYNVGEFPSYVGVMFFSYI